MVHPVLHTRAQGAPISEVPVARSATDGQRGAEGMDFAELWAILRTNLLKVFAVAALVFFAGVAATLLSPMQFVSTGRLYLGELDGPSSTAGSLDISGANHGEVSSEIELIRSRSLVQRAVSESGLNARLRPAGGKQVRFWKWLESGRDQALLDPVAPRIMATQADLAKGHPGPIAYEVKFSDASHFRVSREEVVLGEGRMGTPFEADELSVTLLPGTNDAPRAGSRYDLLVSSVQTASDGALANLEVTAPQKAGKDPIKVVTLTYASDSPRLAASFLNHLMAGYLERRQTWKTEEATAAEKFVTQQLADMQSSLQDLEGKLADYRSNNRVVVLEDEAEAMVGQIGKYEEQRVASRMEVAALADVKQALEQPDAPIEAFMLGEAKDTVLEGLASSLSRERQELAELQARYNDAAPEVRQKSALVDSQLSAIRSYVESRLARARQSLGTLNKIIGQYEAKLKSVPGAELRLAQLMRESEVYSNLYSYLLERKQQAAIIKASDVSKNRVVDEPEVPLRETSPKLALALAAAPVGLLFGAGWVLLFSLFGGAFRSDKEVSRYWSPIPVLGRIPRRKGRASEKRAFLHLFNDLRKSSPYPEFEEAFRSLRAHLYRFFHHETQKVILVSSPSPGDGKTTCTLWLATMLAADGKRVLLVDGDLRKPTHDFIIGENRTTSLREATMSFSDLWPGILHSVAGPFGSFHSLSLEKIPSVDQLGDQMERFFGYVKQSYDYVLVDCASYPAVADAMALADKVDLLLSVVRIRKTKRKLTMEHLMGFATAHTPMAFVLNDVADTPRLAKPYRSFQGARVENVRVPEQLLPHNEDESPPETPSAASGR